MSLNLPFKGAMHGILIWMLPSLFFATAIHADDTPKARCRSVASLAQDVRPSDLAELSDMQRSNVQYYLEEQRRNGGTIAPRIHVLNGLKFRDPYLKDVELSFSVIFESRDCETVCTGTAVLPRASGRTSRKFSYRRNLVVRPVPGLLPAQDAEREFGSLIVLDESGKSLVALFDLYRNASRDESSHEKAYVRSDYLKISSGPNGHDRANYFACLRDIFDIDAPMPGSGAR
ncbi:hypothetical protein [Bradyrhizobium sp. PRIMUS42]|uniref:hypothetical protein n=1 Tax=Bradyrhizobium sp. PRIMUS42 TaxID=2908926 RepID=UPI001FF57D76|nr:hypothetical protein [Bradyrhizobium sp. PRIMUS42]MCJ9728972.1 hypothetical protein [Bradyrhizobium sp. PRIMUS42]